MKNKNTYYLNISVGFLSIFLLGYFMGTAQHTVNTAPIVITFDDFAWSNQSWPRNTVVSNVGSMSENCTFFSECADGVCSNFKIECR
jgi:hypothetical protein